MRTVHLWIGFIGYSLTAWSLTFSPSLYPHMPATVSTFASWMFMAAGTVYAGMLAYSYTEKWLHRL